MDYFDGLFDYTEAEILWLNDPVPVVKQSAFVSYLAQPSQEYVNPRRFPSMNMNNRMVEFLRRNPVASGSEDSERERSRRHMISERIRRGKQKNSYLSLHSILPPGIKNDKNSIVKAAAKEVEELRSKKEELKRQNLELSMKRKVMDGRDPCEESEVGGRAAKIKLRVAYPSSGIDSMLAVLKCLRDTGSYTTSIHSQFSAHEFSAVLLMQPKKMEAGEVEKAVHKSLSEVEMKFQLDLPQR